jgi:hypothetical protein
LIHWSLRRTSQEDRSSCLFATNATRNYPPRSVCSCLEHRSTGSWQHQGSFAYAR